MSGDTSEKPSERRRSRSPRLPSPDLAEAFPLSVVIPMPIKQRLESSEALSRIVERSRVERISWPETADIPDFTDSVLSIVGEDSSSKMRAFSMVRDRQIMEEFAGYYEGRAEFDAKIFIPDSMVSLLIGKKGRQIEQIQNASHTTISVIDKIKGLKDRVVKIIGKPGSITSAARLIYNMVIDKNQVPEDRQAELFQLRFLIPKGHVGVLIGKNGSYPRTLRTNYSVDLQVDAKEGSSEEYAVSVLVGKYEHCMKALPEFVGKLHDAFESKSDNSDIRLLVPASAGTRVLSSCTLHTDAVSAIKNQSRCSIKVSERGADSEVRFAGTERAKTQALELVAERIDAAAKGLRSPRYDDRRSPRYDDRRSRSVERRSRSIDHRRHSPEHRAAINILVLEEHVARLIGRNGDNVKKLKSKTGAHITFQKEATTEVKPESNIKFKVCTIEGTPSQIEDAVRAILDNIKRLQDY